MYLVMEEIITHLMILNIKIKTSIEYNTLKIHK